MNIMVLTEGKGEKHIFKNWIPFVNPNLKFVDNIFQIIRDNYSIVSGNGYPAYYEVIDHAIEDVNAKGNIDRLVISVDSEEMTMQQKHDELTQYLNGKVCQATIFIVIQHFCIETWALGNRRVCPVNPNDLQLIEFKNIFDVRSNDPELLPSYPPLLLNRSQFAALYLRHILNSRNPRLPYQKGKPKPLFHKNYFEQIVLRHRSTRHLSSFATFLNAFI